MGNDVAVRTGQRVILSKGCSEFGQDINSKILYLANEIPHELQFQRVATVVHHAGAGTTAAVLRTGLPTLITPFGLDQSFWLWCIQTIGAGFNTISRRKLKAEKLAAAFYNW